MYQLKHPVKLIDDSIFFVLYVRVNTLYIMEIEMEAETCFWTGPEDIIN